VAGAGVYFEEGKSAPEAITDAEGRFAIENWPHHVNLLTASKEGYGRGTVRVPSVPTDQPITIRLTAAAAIRGSVTIDRQAAAERFSGAGLFIAETEMPTGHSYAGALERGESFEFQHVSPGDYLLEVAIDGHSRVIRRAINVSEGGVTTARFDFDVPADTSLGGAVTRDSIPVPGVRLILRRSLTNDSTLILFAKTDERGNYLFAYPPIGQCEIEAFAEDIGYSGSGRFVTDVFVAESGPTRQDVEIDVAPD
jgi:hypothetical protein